MDDEVVAGSIDESALGDPYIGDLTFVAPKNCSVPMKVTIEEGGQAVVLEYALTFVFEDPETAIAGDLPRIVEVDGEPVPESDQYAFELRIPTFVVTPDGTLTETRGVDTLLGEIARLDPSIEEMASDPGFIQVLTTKYNDDYWRPWYGFWVEWGSFDEPVEEAALMLDANATVPMTVSSLGTTDDGRVAARSEFAIEGDAIRAQMEQVLNQWLPAGLSPEERDDAVAEADGRIDTVLEAVLEPGTLRPHSVWSRRDMSMTLDGQDRRSSEVRLAEFDWAESDCD